MSFCSSPAVLLIAVSRLYVVLASSAAGMGQPLFFVSTPQEVLRVPAGSELRLECEVGGTPQPVVQWIKDARSTAQQGSNIDNPLVGLAFVAPQKPSSDPINLGQVKGVVHRKCATAADAGIYTCVAVTPHDRITATIRVIVETSFGNIACPSVNNIGTSPSIYMWTEMRLTRISSTVRLFCRAEGSPRPAIRWFDSKNNRITSDDQRRTVLPNGDLLIKDVSFDTDMGLFVCVASSAMGTDQVTSFVYPTTK